MDRKVGGLEVEVDAGINLKATIVQSLKYNLLMDSENIHAL